ncbi:MAG: hypothetical protein CYG60_15920 [Actinobacteria bacterium]|nr:MAG: hypothetical protein CYG60_15920 [Actinomycetota bacterium]
MGDRGVRVRPFRRQAQRHLAQNRHHRRHDPGHFRCPCGGTRVLEDAEKLGSSCRLRRYRTGWNTALPKRWA